MKNKIWVQIVVLFLLSFTIGCEEVASVATQGTSVAAVQPATTSVGVATLRSSNVSPTVSQMTFAAEIRGHHPKAPSLLEYTGEATLKGKVSFDFIMTSTCSGGVGLYATNKTLACPISAQVLYNFICQTANIYGKAGAAHFTCKDANVNGRSYSIKGELGAGIYANSSYTIEYVEVCGGPGAPPTCGQRGYVPNSPLITY